MGYRGYRSVIGIDPGKITGYAVFRENHPYCATRGNARWDGVPSRLIDAGTLESYEEEELPHARVGDVVVIEMPRWYPNVNKSQPNDLIDLAALAGRIAGIYYNESHVGALYVYPRNWKGTVPKHIHNARTLAKLTDAERALLPKRPRAKDYDHNMLDAVGLALWQLEKEGVR